MPDKLQADVGLLFALPDAHVVELEGRDAAAFAQAQFINDVAALDAGHWHWSGWLTPKGRLVALFALLKWSDERIWLLLQDQDPDAQVGSLGRFLFRSKVAIRARGDLAVSGAFTAPADAGGARFVEAGDAVELDLGTTAGPRCLRIAQRAAPEDADAVARWTRFDLEHGLPHLGPGQLERWTPQQLSLERLDGFSIKKGCYPGQEIVARTHFLGKAKRRLALLEADAAVAAEADVRAGDRALGSVVSTADADGCHLALAVLPLEPETSPLDIDGAPAREIAFKDGLAR